MSVDTPHRRLNPLTGEWLLVSPQRALRPWQGAKEAPASDQHRMRHDPNCYLCPGNYRSDGTRQNPDYQGTYVFTNDFQAMLPNTPAVEQEQSSDLMQMQAVEGTCRVICFSPRHDLTLPQMDHADIVAVIHTWQQQWLELSERYAWVQIFENKGQMMGCSNPHPHGQIWASNFIPMEPQKEDTQQRLYWQKHHSSMLLDYARDEMKEKVRVVCHNQDWLVVVPYWATWPYETLLMPRVPVQHFGDLTENLKHSLAEILKESLMRMDRLFGVSLPYSMGWHGAPGGDQEQDHWQLHAHFYPPLLRSSTVKKFMVGYEMLAESQRDMTPEQAAKTLREL